MKIDFKQSISILNFFRLYVIAIIILIVVFSLVGLFMGLPVATFFVMFFTGWYTFLSKNLGQLHFNLEMTLCGVVALMIGCYGFHRLALWLRKEKPWKWRWTISIVSLVLFLFAASISMTGIIHQTAWLAKSPITENNRPSVTLANLKQLHISLIDYTVTHSKYPERLDLLDSYTTRHYYHITEAGWEPLIYLGNIHNQYLKIKKESSLPLVMTPSPERGKFFYLDIYGEVSSVTLEELLEEHPALLSYLPHLPQLSE